MEVEPLISRDLSSPSTPNDPIVITTECPEGFEIAPASFGLGVFSTGFFPAGSRCYTGRHLVIPDTPSHFLLKTSKGSFIQDSDTHSVKFSESHRQLYLFDGFMNHSCDPNTYNPPQTDEELASGMTFMPHMSSNHSSF